MVNFLKPEIEHISGFNFLYEYSINQFSFAKVDSMFLFLLNKKAKPKVAPKK